MSGFWAGAVPPWAWVVGALAWIVALLLGMWVGFGRGQAEAEEEAGWTREQARTRHVSLGRVGNPPVPWYQAPEVAHEERTAWEDQALTLANETPGPEDRRGDAWGGFPAGLGSDGTVLEPTAVYGPEDSSVTAWTARQAAKMDAFLKELFEVTDERMREITR